MIILFLAAIATCYFASDYVVRGELKRRAGLMTDEQLRYAAERAEGANVSIIQDEIERRAVAAEMMKRAM